MTKIKLPFFTSCWRDANQQQGVRAEGTFNFPPAQSRDRYVQPKRTTTLGKFQKIYSLNFNKILILLEFILYAYLLFSRIKVVTSIKGVPEGIRELVTFFDYENGWNFIFLFLLFTSIILTLGKRRIAWLLKQTGLICISTTLILGENYIGILTILLFIYFSMSRTNRLFDILPKERLWFFLISISTAILLLYCSMTFNLLCG
jgi:hypothetical protein